MSYNAFSPSEVIQSKNDATIDPTVNDDSTQGYEVLSRWINVTADRELVCVDATAGAAVWIQTTSGAAGGGGGGLGQWDYVAGGAAPAATKITANFDLMSSVTAINIADGSGTDNNFSAAFGAVREGHYLVIRDNAGGAAYGSFLVTAAPVDNTTYWTFTVSTGDVSGSFTAPNTYDVNIIANGDVVGPSSVAANSIPTYADTTGKVIKNSGQVLIAGEQLQIGGVTASGSTLRTFEKSSGPTTIIAGGGYWWARNDTPNTPMFTSDDSTEHPLLTGSKENVRLASTANIVSLATDLEGGTDSLDGVLLAIGDRVLLKDQSTGAENGIYDITAGAATRALDLPIGALAATISMNVQEGTANADTKWKCTNNTGSDVVNTAALVFVDVSGNVVGPGTVGNRFVVLWDGTTGKLVKQALDMSYGGLGSQTLSLGGGAADAAIFGRGTGPSLTAGYGKYWTKSGSPHTSWFTDDAGNDFLLNKNSELTLASNALVDIDATEVVIGGAYLDGSTGATFSWEILGTYNDNGGTGNQDIIVTLYDRGPDGTPVAGVLRSTITITSLDTLDRVSQALTAVSVPGTDTDEIDLDEPRLIEIRAKLDAGGGVDTASILNVKFVVS